RKIEDARLFLDMGIEKVIIGTLAVKEPDVVKMLAEKYGRERIIVALDSKDGKVVIRGWREKTGKRAEEIVKNYEECASEILFTNVNVEGLMKGIDENRINEIVNSTSLGVIVSGGIASIKDVKKVKKSGAAGIVIGSALYTKKIDFKEALKIR
ncbi:MAG: HisA/HisF-related TIM barrel protein, partial [Candidatus Hydrothermarchaeaceae archaeon]